MSPDGADHFAVVINKIVKAVAEEPGLTTDDLGVVECRTLIITGDDDIVSLDHTIELYRGMRNAALAVVPETSHLLLHEKPEPVTRLVSDFLTGDPAPTLMPIRRGAPPEPESHDLPAGLGKPALRALAGAGYTRLDQLASLDEAELGRLHGVGPKALRLLREALTAHR